MINWKALLEAEVTTLPFPHMIIENFLDKELVDEIYGALKPTIFEFRDNSAAWRVQGHNQAGDLAQELSDWDHWYDFIKINFDINLNRKPSFSLQGSSTEVSFGPHTDDHSYTGVFLKIMIYMTPDGAPGTRLAYGNSTENFIESSGNPGSACLFVCNEKSWHFTDFSNMKPGFKRLCMVGNFVDIDHPLQQKKVI